MKKTGKQNFIKLVLYSFGMLYLFTILFVVVFSGSWHSFGSAENKWFYLEYVVLLGSVLFCAGLAGIMLSGRFMYYIFLFLSLAVILAGFFFYWRNLAAIYAIIPVFGLPVIYYFFFKNSGNS